MISVKERIEYLRNLIITYDKAYYGKNEPIVSDYEYDQLYKELDNLEKAYPQFSSPDSPTQRVGSDLTKEFAKVEHAIPMMSIDNTYSEDEVKEWVKRCQKNLTDHHINFIGEIKVDGIAVALHYENGRLVQALTRGNGIVGDDITANARTIRSIPLYVDFKEKFEVRGEAYMTFASFTKLNESMIENGHKPMQNPRNTTAGTLKLLDPKEVAKRKLNFSAYSLISPSHKHSHFENLEYLSSLGFSPVIHSQRLSSPSDLINFVDMWAMKRHELPFPADGLVFKVDAFKQQEQLGYTSKSPRWVIAYKYQPESAITQVESVELNVGRTGVVTPIAKLTPVFLAGTTIKNATLHNFDEIVRLDLRELDFVQIEKGGEIIPKVIKVIHEKRDPKTSPFKPPTLCPSCGSLLGKLEGEVALRCFNNSCKAQIFASLEHFVSRSAMDIQGFGPVLIRQLLEHNKIKTIADLYVLTFDDLVSMERMGKKSANNILTALEKSKSNSLDKLIHGLGIRMIGAQSAKILSHAVNDISDLYTKPIEELQSIETIGPTMAQSIRMYFDRDENREVIEQLRSHNVNLTGGIKKKGGPLSGLTFVLTGTLPSLTREEASQIIEDQGGKVSSSVSAKTSYVLAGADPGSKIDKARKLGIKIIDESGFRELLK